MGNTVSIRRLSDYNPAAFFVSRETKLLIGIFEGSGLLGAGTDFFLLKTLELCGFSWTSGNPFFFRL